jgi:hypothetical protein
MVLYTGWWWLEPWNFMTFHSVGNGIIIPTDELHHFSEGLKHVETTNQYNIVWDDLDGPTILHLIWPWLLWCSTMFEKPTMTQHLVVSQPFWTTKSGWFEQWWRNKIFWLLLGPGHFKKLSGLGGSTRKLQKFSSKRVGYWVVKPLRTG